MSDHPCSAILRVMTALPFGPRGALACIFIRVSSLELVASTPPASKAARMNNVVRNYT
jgi:hypothetical protein